MQKKIVDVHLLGGIWRGKLECGHAFSPPQRMSKADELIGRYRKCELCEVGADVRADQTPAEFSQNYIEGNGIANVLIEVQAMADKVGGKEELKRIIDLLK